MKNEKNRNNHYSNEPLNKKRFKSKPLYFLIVVSTLLFVFSLARYIISQNSGQDRLEEVAAEIYSEYLA